MQSITYLRKKGGRLLLTGWLLLFICGPFVAVALKLLSMDERLEGGALLGLVVMAAVKACGLQKTGSKLMDQAGRIEAAEIAEREFLEARERRQKAIGLSVRLG